MKHCDIEFLLLLSCCDYSNLDPLTETYGLSFYLQYAAHWPEYFQVMEHPGGQLMGYSKCCAIAFLVPIVYDTIVYCLKCFFLLDTQ